MADDNLNSLLEMNRLAVARRNDGDLTEAIRIEREVLDKSRSILGDDGELTLLAQTNLAEMLLQQGDLTAARTLQEDAVERSRRVLGESSIVTVAAIAGLGHAVRKQGDPSKARELLEEAITLSTRVNGEESAATLAIIEEVAVLMQEREVTDARGLFEKILGIRRRQLGGYHRKTLEAKLGLATVVYTQARSSSIGRDSGEWAEALRLMQEVLLSSRELFGDEDLLTLVAMRTLGELYEDRDELRAARKVLEQALATSRRVLGEEHELTLAMMTSLATVLRRQGDLRGALDLQEPAFRTSRQLLGEEHLFTLTAMDDLAEILKDQGNDSDARDLREVVVEARGRLIGKEHPETLKAFVNLAAVLYKLGDYERARELDEKAFSLMRDRLGEEHPWTLIVMDNLAAVTFAQGDLAGARELQERVLPALQRLHGEYHPDTLLAMNNLAITIAGQGDLIGARILQEHTLDKSRRTLGPEHFDTLRAKVNLASILKSQGIGGTGVEGRCVHCLQPLEKRTADHIFPRSWYPKGTAESVQRWTAPSCPQCNKRLGAAEKDLMVSLAMCIHDSSLDSSDISERALRALAIGTAGLSEKEQAHREKYRRKILSRVLPYFTVKHMSQSVHGASSEQAPLGELEPVMVITLDLVSPVAEKIVRGLEFKLAGRYIEPPLSLKTFIVPVERAHEWDELFEKTTELQFGPGFKVFRAVPNASDVIVMYRIVIWETFTIHVAVGQFGT